MLQNKRWNYNLIDEEKVSEIVRSTGVPPLLAKVFASRGMEEVQTIRRFLHPSLEELLDPFLMKGMEQAAERIVEALESKEKIVVYGDYDVDGITSTSLLMNFFSSVGADASYYIPDRLEEGYGLTISALEKILAAKPSLIITVDCGITAVDEIRHMKQYAVDIIVTDHHECKEELPDAYAVINPHQPGCMYPFKELAGVGVTFKVVHAVCERMKLGKKYLEYLDLAALGTVADVVPLVGENRIIVKFGIENIEKTQNPGLVSLMGASGLQGKPVTSWSIGFGLAPRINAAGRLGDARRAVELFTTGDYERAGQIAEELNEENRFRQETEAEIFRQAVELVEAELDPERDRVIVAAGPDWHHGVIGIVASKLSDRYYRPCILLSVEDGVCKGSGRSIEGFNLFKVLKHCEAYLDKYGGHELAAGLSLKYEKLEAFKRSLNEYAQSELDEEALIPKVNVDVEVNSDDITLDAVRQLELLAPFGAGNPSPVFAYRGLKLLDGKTVGGDKHAKLKFDGRGLICEAIGFNMGPYLDKYRFMGLMDVACSLEINVWNSNEKLQMNLKDIKPYDWMTGKIIDAEAVVPDREDLARVYKFIRANPQGRMRVKELNALAGKISQGYRSELNAFKVLKCMEIFQELKLLQIEWSEKEGMLVSLSESSEGRVNLESSQLYNKLQSIKGVQFIDHAQ